VTRPAGLLAVALVAGALGTASWAGAQGADCLPIDTFADSQIGQFPTGWRARKDAGKAAYTVQEEGGLRFLRAVSSGLGIQAGREYEWDLAKYPVLAWSWRPRLFPQGADERESAKNDSPLAVYMTVPHSRISGPKAVKYIWSERVPVGTRLSSNMGLTQVIVLRSGPPSAREAWVEERVNALEDYTRLFGEPPAVKPAGIAVLTDADDTRSRAEGDYANFRVCPP
jgi:Protein of unknown function (DUF3047)